MPWLDPALSIESSRCVAYFEEYGHRNSIVCVRPCMFPHCSINEAHKTFSSAAQVSEEAANYNAEEGSSTANREA